MDLIDTYINDATAYFIIGKYKSQHGFDHEKQVMLISLYLFDNLMEENSLKPYYRSLLKYSSLFHDLGYYINKKDHHLHSSYIIKNEKLLREIPDNLRSLLALICENHRKAPPCITQPLHSHDQEAILKLIAILRISDALSTPGISSAIIHGANSETTLDIDFVTIPNELFLSKLSSKAWLFTSLFQINLNLKLP